jgi:hypothetical protein
LAWKCFCFGAACGTIIFTNAIDTTVDCYGMEMFLFWYSMGHYYVFTNATDTTIDCFGMEMFLFWYSMRHHYVFTNATDNYFLQPRKAIWATA